jgi:putative Mn2+ efflux pump MntP
MSLNSLIIGTLTISIFHAVLPSHWLTFVLVGSAQKWSKKKIMRLMFLAGSGHVLMTTILGLVAATIAKGVLSYLEYFDTFVTSGILIVLGLVYIFLGIKNKTNEHDLAHGSSNKANETSLFLMLTLSPCEAMIPVFFVAGTMDWSTILMLSLVVTLSTIGIMISLTFLALAGYSRIHFPWLERNEKTVVGAILFVLGVFAFFV